MTVVKHPGSEEPSACPAFLKDKTEQLVEVIVHRPEVGEFLKIINRHDCFVVRVRGGWERLQVLAHIC
jgi:hypothetical protein